MEKDTGWIRQYRKVLNNPIICKDADYFAVWHYLLLNATHKQINSVFNGKKIILKSGQLITGRKKIAEKFNIDESKVQRILKVFENEQQIEQQTSSRNRLITIKKWKEYQPSEQQNKQRVNNERTTNEHIQECNNVIFINLFKRYKGENIKKFNDRIKFLHSVREDKEFQGLDKNEQDKFINMILGGT